MTSTSCRTNDSTNMSAPLRAEGPGVGELDVTDRCLFADISVVTYGTGDGGKTRNTVGAISLWRLREHGKMVEPGGRAATQLHVAARGPNGPLPWMVTLMVAWTLSRTQRSSGSERVP